MILSTPKKYRQPRTASYVPTVRWTREWQISVVSLACWFFAPCLRRILDWRSGGFHAIDVLSIVPYLATFPLIPYAFRKEALDRIPKSLKVFSGIWTASLLYGLLVAGLAQNAVGGFFEFLQYEVPCLFGFWLAGQSLPCEQTVKRITTMLLWFALAVGIYGIEQWISPPPWDVLWIQASNTEAMGQPVPFGLRIFSTLNSTGPAADFFALCLLFSLPTLSLRRVLPLFVFPITAAALMLTLVRTAWLGSAIGILGYLLTSPRRLSTLPYLVAASVLVVGLAGTLPSLLGASGKADAITARFATLNDVEHDDSAVARQQEFDDAIDGASKNPIGLGLGSFGSSARLSGAADAGDLGRVIDGGYIARLLSLGWFGFVLYISVTIGIPLWILFRWLKTIGLTSQTGSAGLAVGFAVSAYLVWDDVAGDSHIGITGLIFWIATALAVRSIDEAETAVA